MKQILSSLALLTLVGCSSTGGDDWFEVTVVSASGAHSFTVEIADDAAERTRGLMFRREMADDAGMLFLFDEAAPRSFWMSNTYISLDIIYIGEDGRIVSIAERTTPFSERSIPSFGPAIAVLEVNGGTSDRLQFAAGDEVRHPFFETLTDGD